MSKIEIFVRDHLEELLRLLDASIWKTLRFYKTEKSEKSFREECNLIRC